MNQPHKKSSYSEISNQNIHAMASIQPRESMWGGGGGGGGGVGGGIGPIFFLIIIKWPRAKARRGVIFNIIV